MDNALSIWLSRLLLILMCLSPFFIARAGEQYYITATTEKLAENYIATVKNGQLDINEYTNFCYQAANFGYGVEIIINRYGADGYYDVITTEEITNAVLTVNGRQIYQLQKNDFIYVKLTSNNSVIKESIVYHGEEIQ